MKDKRIIKVYKNKQGEIQIGLFADKNASDPIQEVVVTENQLEPTLENIKNKLGLEIINEVRDAELNEDNLDLDDFIASVENPIINNDNYEDDTYGNEEGMALQKNNSFKKIIKPIIGVILVVGLACGVVKGCKKIKTVKLFANEGTKTEQSLNDTIVVATPVVELTPEPTEIPVEYKNYTIEEKQEFIAKNVENFKNEIAQVKGMDLDTNEALIQLGFINNLTSIEVGANTKDYVLDFVNDYEAYWDRVVTQVKNNLMSGKEIKGDNYALLGDIYGKYIMDDKERIGYEYYASKTYEMVNEAYNGNKDKALELALEKNKLNAETLVYDNNPDIGFDVSDLTPEIQYMIRRIAYNDTECLPEKTEFTVNTLAGEAKMLNFEVNVRAKTYEYGNEDYDITGNLRNDINYYLGRDSVNATLRELGMYESECLPEDTKGKTLVK